MESLASIPIKIALPIVFLGLQSTLKLVIGRKVTAFFVVLAIFELPVGIVSVSLSLLAAFVVLGLVGAEKFFVIFLIFLGLFAVAVVLWKTCADLFEDEKFAKAGWLCALNHLISLPTLAYSVYLLLPRV